MLRNIFLIWFFFIVPYNTIFGRTFSEDNIFDIKGNNRISYSFSDDVIDCLFPREQLWKNIIGQQENMDNVFLQSRENIGNVFYNKELSFGPIFSFSSFIPIGFYTEGSYTRAFHFGELSAKVYCYDNVRNVCNSIIYRIFRDVGTYKVGIDNIKSNNIVSTSSDYLSHDVKINFNKKGFLEMNLFLKNKHYKDFPKNNDSGFGNNVRTLDSLLSEFKIIIFDKIIVEYNTISNFQILQKKNNPYFSNSNYIIIYKGDSAIQDGFEVLKNISNFDIKIYYNLYDYKNCFNDKIFIVKFKKPVFCKRFYDDDDKTLEVSFIVDFPYGSKLLFDKLPFIVLPNIDFQYTISHNHTIYLCLKGGYVVKSLYQRNRDMEGYVTAINIKKDNMIDYLNTCFTYRYLYGYNFDTNIGLKIKCQKYFENIKTNVPPVASKTGIYQIEIMPCKNIFMFIPFLEIILLPHYNCKFKIKEKCFLFSDDGNQIKYDKFVKNKLNINVIYDNLLHSVIFTIDYFITQEKNYLRQDKNAFLYDGFVFSHHFDVKCEYKYKISNNIFFFVNIKNLERIFLIIFNQNLHDIDNTTKHKIKLEEDYLGNKKQRMHISLGVKSYYK